MFLDEVEWRTYCKRKPVRYIRTLKADVCQICKQPESPENPLQFAHIIGFDIGVIELGLTPDFLDSEKNIVTAHRRSCNKQSELNLRRSMERLRDIGVRELPQYLPVAIQQVWDATAKQSPPL